MSANHLAVALQRQEAIIERGLGSFLEVGDALLTIRSERLYLQTHETFAEYCMERWGFCDSRARQLVMAAKVVTNVTAAGLPGPANEGQARELAKVAEPDRERVWRETLERTDGKPTAAAIREVTAPAAEPKPVVTEPKPKPAKVTPAAKQRRERTSQRRQEEPAAASAKADDGARRVFKAAAAIAWTLKDADLGDLVDAIDPGERAPYAAQCERSIAQLDRLLEAMKAAASDGAR